MNLAEKIKDMTDSALFERLANAVLRQKYPGLTNLIAGGINEKGETVKGKLDAFTQAAAGHYILVEHTINDSNLEGKWLYDRSTYTGKKAKPTQSDGDLIKAIKEADTIRKSIPAAKFTVFLTSNQMVDSGLWAKVLAIAAKGTVEIELLEQSAIADYLNYNAKGQYLRKVFFDIDYELLSEDSLLEIQNKNLNIYAIDNFIKPDLIEAAGTIKLLTTALGQSKEQLMLIVANSGMGKSTLCYAYMAELHNEGAAALRVTPEMVDSSTDIDTLIRCGLSNHLTKLFWNADAQELVRKQPLYLFVDDLNNFSNPLKVLDKLIAWSFARLETDKQIRVICPVWPQFFQQIPNSEKKKEAYAVFRLDIPNPPFAIAILRKSLSVNNFELGPLQEEAIVKNAGYDPLLIGLYAQLIIRNGSYSVNQGSKVIGDYIKDKLKPICQSMRLPINRVDSLLYRLGEQMFIRKVIAPTYNEACSWVNDLTDSQKILDELTVQGELWALRDDNRLHFRHDRIRNHSLADGIKGLIPKIDQHINAFEDPFFAPQIGMAISGGEMEDTAITKLLSINPETVFHALGFLQTEDGTIYFERVLNCINAWKGTADFQLENDSVLYGVLFDLLNTDTKKIRMITDKLPYGRVRYMAEMRNGDLVGAVNFFASHNEFEPDFGDSRRNGIIRHVKSHHPGMVSELEAALRRDGWSSPGRRGAYLLAGYLSDAKLLPALWENWSAAPEADIYPHLLWGILHCCSNDYRQPTNDALAYFHSLPDERDEKDGYPKGTRNLTIYWFSRIQWQFSFEQITLLDALFATHETLMASIFSHIDHPLTIERTVNDIGTNLDKYPKSHYAVMQPDDRWDFKKNNYRLSEPSRNRLREIWSDRSRSSGVRHVALRFWAENETNEVAIEGMRTIQQTDTDLYRDVVWRRALHGDQQVTTQFLPKLLDNKFHWIRIIQHIWNQECIECYQQLIDKYRKGHANVEHLEDFTEVLREIPQNDGVELLVKNWALFKNDQTGIQTALYLATEETRALAAVSIKESKAPTNLFDHISQRYGCYNTPKEQWITIDKLQSLEPYLDLLPDYSQKEFAEQCFRSHFQHWLYDVLLPKMNDEKKAYYRPSTTNLITEINQQLTIKSHFLGRQWLRHIQQRQIPVSSAMEALKEWANISNSLKGLTFLAECLTEVGSRADLSLLDVYVVTEDMTTEKQNKIRKAAIYEVCKRSLT